MYLWEDSITLYLDNKLNMRKHSLSEVKNSIFIIKIMKMMKR